ncbi:MAG: T9SS type A sorting domain-containing protein [Clostridia bacterium]|nr:T9SS type A sorting domain-containing protein [Clostridia bacterium]
MIFDRSASGALTGNTDFARVQQAPLPAENGKIRLQILVDRSSIEIFANGGKVVMTNLIFPDTTSNGMKIFATGGEVFIDSLKIWKIKAPNSGTPVPEINKAPADQIRIFPNPAAQQDITIQLLHSLVTRKFVCNIYDGIGNKITTITEQGLHQRYDIANNIFPANGIYLVQILTDAGSTTRKLLIKR